MGSNSNVLNKKPKAPLKLFSKSLKRIGLLKNGPSNQDDQFDYFNGGSGVSLLGGGNGGASTPNATAGFGLPRSRSRLGGASNMNPLK